MPPKAPIDPETEAEKETKKKAERKVKKEANKQKIQKALSDEALQPLRYDVSEWKAGIIVDPNQNHFSNLVQELQEHAYPLPYEGGVWRIQKKQDSQASWSVSSYRSSDRSNPIGVPKVLRLKAHGAAAELRMRSTAEIFNKGFEYYKNNIASNDSYKSYLKSFKREMENQGGLTAWFNDANLSEQSRNAVLSSLDRRTKTQIDGLKDFYEKIGILASKVLVVKDTNHLRRIVKSWKNSGEGKEVGGYTTRQVNDAVAERFKIWRHSSNKAATDKLNGRMNSQGLPLPKATKEDEDAVCEDLKEATLENYIVTFKNLKKFCSEGIGYGPQTAEERIHFEALERLIDHVQKWRNGEKIPINEINDEMADHFKSGISNAYKSGINKLKNRMNSQELPLWEATKKDEDAICEGISEKRNYSNAIRGLREFCKDIGCGPKLEMEEGITLSDSAEMPRGLDSPVASPRQRAEKIVQEFADMETGDIIDRFKKIIPNFSNEPDDFKRPIIEGILNAKKMTFDAAGTFFKEALFNNPNVKPLIENVFEKADDDIKMYEIMFNAAVEEGTITKQPPQQQISQGDSAAEEEVMPPPRGSKRKTSSSRGSKSSKRKRRSQASTPRSAQEDSEARSEASRQQQWRPLGGTPPLRGFVLSELESESSQSASQSQSATAVSEFRIGDVQSESGATQYMGFLSMDDGTEVTLSPRAAEIRNYATMGGPSFMTIPSRRQRSFGWKTMTPN